MTGYCKGKVKIGGREIVILKGKEVVKEVDVYIHVKGFAFARVTHVDVEYGNFWKYIKDGYVKVKGIKNGIEISYYSLKCKVEVNYPFLEEGKETVAFIGRKENGFFLGFRKSIIKRLEEIAKKLEPDLFSKK